MFQGDIAAFFDTISHELLRAQLFNLLHDRSTTDLIMQWVAAPVLTDNGLAAATAGLPQGAPISPALANHYVADLDKAVDGRRGRLVRYADDLAVLCPDEDAARGAQWDVERQLAALELRLNPDKNYLSSFNRRFSFLGWVFFRDDGYEESPSEAWTHPWSVGRPRVRGPS